MRWTRSLGAVVAGWMVVAGAPTASAFHTPFAYRVDRFEADGNTFGPLDGVPGYVDEFGDGTMSPYWYQAYGTATESGGYLVLQNPGVHFPSPDGSALAVVRSAGGLEQIEFPMGRVIYKTSGFVSSIRFSPSGDRIAFADHPVFADDAGGVSVVTLEGHRTVLAESYISVRGVAWSRDGREVWYAAREGGANSRDSVYAATLTGGRRVIWSSPSSNSFLTAPSITFLNASGFVFAYARPASATPAICLDR